MGTAVQSRARDPRASGEAVAGRRALPRAQPQGGEYEGQRPRPEGDRLANFLGWFSIGLGVAEIAAPGAIARLVGVNDDGRSRSVMRSAGVREIAHGIGIFSSPRPAGAVWSRVAGDMMDLALLGKALSDDDNQRNRTAAATAAVLGITALDVLCAQKLSRSPEPSPQVKEERSFRRVHTRRSITVRRPLEEVFAFWHEFENLPRFMRHLESVRNTGPGRSHWKAKAPAGQTVEWDAIITEDAVNERIAWRSAEGGDVYTEGRVIFVPAPGGRGTEVRVDLIYEPPGGRLGSKLAMLFRAEPGQQVQDDLRAFKQVMETGDVVVSDATLFKGPHPARPPEFPININA